MERVVQLTNDKAKTMIYADDSVRFINKKVSNYEEFNTVFDKKVSLVDKGELKFSEMKKITLDGLSVDPHVGMKLGNSMSDINFENENDRDEFIKYVSEMKGCSKKETQLTPFHAAKWNLLRLIFTTVFAYVFYRKAIEIEVGTYIAREGHSKSARQSHFFD